MEELNLCKILKGHEGESFYCLLTGGVLTLHEVEPHMLVFESPFVNRTVRVFDDGAYYTGGECIIFPSKNNRDWHKWIEEHNPKVPKTWSEVIEQRDIFTEFAEIGSNHGVDSSKTFTNTPIEKSALALLKIHQLIESGYGGNVINEEWYSSNPKWIIAECSNEEFIAVCVRNQQHRSHVAFHTEAQAKEFLSYPENVELLNDYFII